MSYFVGVWKLDKPIYCKKDISGKWFKSCIAGVTVSLGFPYCPETYSSGPESLINGDLIAPLGIFKEQINWGMIHAWPEGLFSVNALYCVFSGEEADAQRVYTDFLRWKEKVNDLVLIDSGKFVYPEQKTVTFLQYGNGVYDGIELFKAEDRVIKRVVNNRELEPITVQMIGNDQCYDTSKMELLFQNAGDSKDIVISYKLLIVAYRAVFRHDFRSAIIIAATALEKSIVNRIKKYYIDNHLTTFENDKNTHRMLGNKFRWLNELGIAIPVSDYQTEILDIRNPTAHEGSNQNLNDTMKYLDNCKLLIEEYSPDVLGD